MEKTTSLGQHAISLITARDEPDLHRLFEVSDDSMSDGTRHSYECGDMIIAYYMPQHLWQIEAENTLRDFVIIHRSYGAMLRRVACYDTITGTLALHSLNPMQSDFTIGIVDILHIYMVIKVERTR